MTTQTAPKPTPTTRKAEAAIHVQELSHQYPPPKQSRRTKDQPKPRALALDGVGFEVKPGEIFGILGPNGSGKSTLFKVLATMLRTDPGDSRTKGAARIMGHDVVLNPDRVRQQLGVVFQSPSLDGKLTAAENLRHHGRLYGIGRFELSKRINHWLAHWNLTDRQHELVERYSGGMRRRVEVAKAILHEPKLLLMDEPSTGLDPAARRDLWDMLLELREKRGMTIVLTTHLMDEADRCDRLAIMNEGKLIAADTPDRLKAKIGGDIITVEPESPDIAERLAVKIEERFGPWEKNATPIVIDGRVRFEKPDGARVVADVAAAYPNHIRGLSVGRPTVEDVFLRLTGASLGNTER